MSVLLGAIPDLDADGPLPEFKLQGVVLHPNDLKYSPNDDLIHPTIVKTEGRIKNPLGKYYLYHAPHKHIATSLAYADSLEGPWIEYKQNPVVEGPSAPDVRWVEEHQKFFLWGHRKNSQTELWTSEDGLHFTYHSVSITAGNIGTRNATYSRMYEYPLEKYGSKYIMLYSGFLEDRGIRCVWLAHSKDAENWVPLKTPLVEPIAGEMNDCYGPSLFRWKGKNYVVYQDHTSWRGGNLKYVEVDRELSPVGAGGTRYVLMDPPDEPPLNNRIRGAEFYFEDGKIYLFTSASKGPRLIVYATAELEEPVQDELIRLTQTSDRSPTQATQTAAIEVENHKPKPPKKKKKQAQQSEPRKSVSLDDILKDLELETLYETSFEEPLRVIHEDQLADDKTLTQPPSEEIDWVLEGKADVSVKEGRLHLNNDDYHAVLWNTRTFPESFVAEWDFQHEAPQGTAIIFFAAQAHDGGSIFQPGLPKRGARFGFYTRGEIDCYHTSYSATNEQGVPRGATHLKKDGQEVEKNKLANGASPIDGKTDKSFHLRLAKLKNRIILEIDGEVSFDVVDDDSPYGKGQIGFRQMRHTLEASYGGLKVSSVKFPEK
ncbi:MAG: DUF1961 family protein [Planctomycetaceae bacterium]|nr:DUF1961 family protein [Planctomycetaceae bacterium]